MGYRLNEITTDAPAPTRYGEIKLHSKKLGCPNCSRSARMSRQYTGKKKAERVGECDASDFTCPFCKADLLLCCALFGGLYFSFNKRIVDYSK